MIRLNDTDYTSELILQHRDDIISLRGEALNQGDFWLALIFSINIGLLYELAWKESVEEAAKNK